MKIRKYCYFQNRFQCHYRFQYQSEISVIQIKKKRINFLFIAVIFPVIDPSEHIDTI